MSVDGGPNLAINESLATGADFAKLPRSMKQAAALIISTSSSVYFSFFINLSFELDSENDHQLYFQALCVHLFLV